MMVILVESFGYPPAGSASAGPITGRSPQRRGGKRVPPGNVAH